MNVLVAEEQLLLQCLRSLVKNRPLAETFPDVHWEQAYALAARHNLVPVLEMALSGENVPEKAAGQILLETRRRRMRAAVMIEDFKTIHQKLVEADIRVMPIKGIALAHTIYPSVSLRYFDDIDLLVPAEKGPRALEILRKIGYIVHPRAPKPDWHHFPPYIHRKHNTMIEIHTDLVRRARPGWDIDQIWQRAERGQIAGQETWLMSPHDALIYTALHARHNLYNRLSFFVDAALLALKFPPDEENRRQLASLAAEAGGQAALAHLLAIGSLLFELPALPQIPRNGRQRWLAHKTAGWQSLQPGRSSLKQGPLPKLLELLLMDSLGDSLRLAGRLIAPPSEFVSQGYGHEESKTAGYGKRLRQRLGLAAGQFVKVLRDK